jgi:hypothetical protein
MSLLLLFALLDAGPPSDGGVLADAAVESNFQLQAELMGTGAQPGDSIFLQLQLRYHQALAIDLPDELPQGKGMASLGAPERQPEAEGEFIRETLRFPFVLLALDGVRSPSFTLKVGDEELAVPALPLIVADAGPSPEPPDPQLEGMVVYRPGPAPWILPTLAGLALLVLLAWGFRRWLLQRPDAEEAPPEIDAGRVFLDQLTELRSGLSDEPEVLKSCWFSLLEGLCLYLDRRFALRSAQSTTEEMLSALASARLVGFPRVGLRSLLHQADAVRYAAEQPSREAMGDLLDQVETWVSSAELSMKGRV